LTSNSRKGGHTFGVISKKAAEKKEGKKEEGKRMGKKQEKDGGLIGG